ncbi:hypothetical protein BDV96DRAFT_642343 [Lophiotrema nucula]|uniref:F-box domain-containing protein n=1 Tax=Lophiotrema nucula TaxID=690887 RepID=A0A6A5ZM41_9PLEO|nr:hypothetical protein BDV96DRAFT_642343 [Lophiotrema nucula]
MRLHDLPDDILIPILSLCDIDTLFAARLTSRPLRTVIDSYIKTIAPHVARKTFPNIPGLHRVPEKGASLKWLRGLIPAYLSTVALDKDKLRRFPYVNSGFPYGIPCESEAPLARYWRRRVTNGWRVLRCFYLISRDVYSKPIQELEGRPTVMRRVSTGVKATRIWQTVSCPYQACNEHGVRHIFDIRRGSRDHSHSPVYDGCRRGSEGDFIEEVKRRESLVLKKRLEWMATLKQDQLLDYMYVWRLLLWMFRPYRKPDTTLEESVKGRNVEVPRVNWQAELTNVSQGCSWLNWFVLHVGSTPFWQQWYDGPSKSKDKPHVVRDLVWKNWMRRSHHQIELEREYISKFEFAVRKRSLDPQRLKRLNEDLRDDGLGAAKTISLDCIPWEYDQNPIINKPTCDFPWYNVGSWVYMNEDVWMRIGGRQGRIDYITSRGRPDVEESEESDESDEEEGSESGRGPLEKVPYLVYLSVNEEKSLQADPRDLTRYGIVF